MILSIIEYSFHLIKKKYYPINEITFDKVISLIPWIILFFLYLKMIR